MTKEEKYKELYETTGLTETDLKRTYNYFLKRYKNGCKYLSENPDKFDLYIHNLMEIHEHLNSFLQNISCIEEVTPEQIIGGFEIGS